jgi:hypothetical protein
MKKVFVVMYEDTDYRWDGERSVPFKESWPGLVFESKADAEKAALVGRLEIFEVNMYAEGEEVK